MRLSQSGFKIMIKLIIKNKHLTFVGSVRFFHPRHNGQWPPTSRDILSQILSLHLFSYLYSWERASIYPFECSVLNKGITGTILVRLWYDAVLDWGLNPGPPALEASTLPLGYRGGGTNHYKFLCFLSLRSYLI